MTLTDLYCVYNRARGIDLISPNDLLKAVEKLDKMELGIELKVCPPSFTVVKLSSIDDRETCSNIASLCTKTDNSSSNSGLDYLTVARALNISIDIAKVQLRMAIDLGYICEDSDIYGTYYFPNLFDSFL